MKRTALCGAAILVVLFCVTPISAQNLDWNITGAGARAEGFGGAFIGVADDATSIVWNPAGLATLEKPEASLVTRFVSEKTDYTDVNPTYNASESQSHISLNFGSFALPLKAGGNNIVLAVAFQRQLDLTSKTKNTGTDFESTGGANTITPGIGVKISPMISLGLAANIWMSQYDMTSKMTSGGTLYTQTSNGTFSGMNFALGALVDFSSGTSRLPLKVGVSVKTPFELKVDQTFKTTPQIFGYALNDAKSTLTAQMPLMLGFGASYQPSDKFTLALDYEARGYGGKEYSQDISGTVSKGQMSDSKESLNQIRVGGEYLFITSTAVIPVRIGFRTVPTVMANIDNSGNSTGQVSGSAFSLGSGYIADKFAVDVAYSSTSYEQTLGTAGKIKYSIGTLSASVIFYL